MVDVETKNNKRKGFSGNTSPNKKQKQAKNEGSIKQKPEKPQKNQKNNESKLLNGAKSEQNKKVKPQNKEKKASLPQDPSSKKVKPFAGTSEIKPKSEPEQKNQSEKAESKRKRRPPFFNIKEKVRTGDKTVLNTVDEKIKAIEKKGDLSKSAAKKLKSLKRLRRAITGEKAEVSEQKQVTAKEKKANKKQKAGKPKSQNDAKPKASKAKSKPVKVVEEEESDDDDDEDQLVAGSDAEIDNSGDEEGNSDEDAGEEAESEEASDDDESEEEEKVLPKVEKKRSQGDREAKPKSSWNIGIDDLKKNDLLVKNQKRYVVFVGNIPYDANKSNLKGHFEKCGTVKHIRIPTEKKSNKPRGFAYVEVEDDASYQKCMSMHHSFLNGRRINVLYTQGGKKKGDEMKKQIKAKNFKLHAMRKQGQLIGSTKETQKRSFRRKKQKQGSTEENLH